MTLDQQEPKQDSTDYKDLGKRVRAARQQLGLTQEALAEQVDISASFLGHIERGTRVASIATLVALCNTLNVTPEHLLRASLHLHGVNDPAGLTPQQQTLLHDIHDSFVEAIRKYNQD